MPGEDTFLINPFGWVLFANGRVGRSLRIALVIAPVTILACVLGLPHGPTGVAIGFSTAMVLLVAPVVFWAKEGTSVTGRDTFGAILPPASSILAGVGLTFVLWPWLSEISWPLLRLAASCGVMFGAYLAVLLLPFGQGRIYVDLLRDTGLWPARWSPVSARGN